MSIRKKKELVKKQVVDKYGVSSKTTKIHRLIDLMEESNIPVGYWFLTMKGFAGSQKLKEVVDDYIENIQDNYMNGSSVCFAGNQGTGKTMSSICMLKAALKSGFSAHYTTASDMLTSMTSKHGYEYRRTMRGSDFLVIDELDSRFFTSDSVKELFSGKYEEVFRYRAHNNLPTIVCTNETESILNVFCGAGKQSIESLNSQYLKIYPVAGKDFRKRVENAK